MKYFTIKELISSSTATQHNINNTPTKEIEENLKALVDNILDPLREAYGKPIIVNSGFRCEKLNNLVGGSRTSQHRTGHAADIKSVSDSKSGNTKMLKKQMKLPTQKY